MLLKRGKVLVLLLWTISAIIAIVESQNFNSDDEYAEDCYNEIPLECGSPKVEPRILSRMRIVGGIYATPNSWPWQLSLQVNSYIGVWKHICGASILSRCYAVTAAHCVEDYEQEPTSVRLHANLHDRAKDLASVHSVQRVHLHPNYKGHATQWDYDIAILQVNPPFRFSRNVSAVCLPTGPPVEGEQGAATGWGYGKNGGLLNTTLNQVEMPVITRSSCRQYYREVVSFDHRFCAGFPKTGGKDTCQGDSGGPFVTRPQSTTFHLAGVTSVGANCAEINKPGIYTDVFQFRDWILSHLYECGIRSGDVSKPSWMISLRNVGKPTVHECLGVVVGNNWILTTKLCVSKVTSTGQAKVVRISSPSPNVAISNVSVDKIFCNSTAGACLLKTSTRMGLTGACLPTEPVKYGVECTAYGWTRVAGRVIARQCIQQPTLTCTSPRVSNLSPCTGDHADFTTCPSGAGDRQYLYGLVLNVCADQDGASQLFDVYKNMDWISRVMKTN